MSKKKSKKESKEKDKKKVKKSLLEKLKMTKKKDSKKKKKKKDSKKKDSKKKDSKKKGQKKKDSKKKKGKKKSAEKVHVEKPLRAKFAQQKIFVSDPKPVLKATTEPASKPPRRPTAGKADKSTNYNVKDAIAKLRAIKSRDELMVFIKGEKRVTITKVIPATLNKLKQ